MGRTVVVQRLVETAQSGSLFNGMSSTSDENLERVRDGSDKENISDIDLDLFVSGQRILDPSVNADELGEWDKAELRSIVASPPPLTTPAVSKKSHPWNTDFELENSELDLSVFNSVRGEEQIRFEICAAVWEMGESDV